MTAIWLNVILGVITAVTGGLAGHLAAQNKLHKWAFWSAALVSIALLVVQGFLFQRDVKLAEERGKTEQAQLNRIEKNTGQPPNVIINPPVVNVTPPANPPIISTSNVVLDHFDSSYSQTVKSNGVPIAQINEMFRTGWPVSLNYYFKNIGNARADQVWSAGQVLIATTETEEALTNAFNEELAKENKNPAITSRRQKGSLEPGGNSLFWFTVTSGRPIADDDLTKLANGGERLYFFISLSYHDLEGHHYMHFCEHLQPPDVTQTNQPAIWQFCHDFSDRR